MRADPREYRALDLRAHALLHDVPLHDVWAVDLPGEAGPGGVLELQDLLSLERIAAENRAVRWLFALRGFLGGRLGWDAAPGAGHVDSYGARLTERDRQTSQLPPGAPFPPFTALYVSEHEAIAEIINATVHAFSVMTLHPGQAGQRCVWAIHVKPVGWITRFYMALIDPFRRWIVYPAVLAHLKRSWLRARSGPLV